MCFAHSAIICCNNEPVIYKYSKGCEGVKPCAPGTHLILFAAGAFLKGTEDAVPAHSKPGRQKTLYVIPGNLIQAENPLRHSGQVNLIKAKSPLHHSGQVNLIRSHPDDCKGLF